MRLKILRLLLAIFLGGLGCQVEGQGTAFFYQGHLNSGGSSANGSFDFQFSLYDASTNGNLIGGPVTNLALTVTGGLFATNIDFGAVFTGTNYWLAIGVRTNGGGTAFTGLQPRQALLPVPYAVFANSASNLVGTLPASQLSGALASAQLSGSYAGAVAFGNSANSFTGTFTGNGSALINLNASQVTSGTVADARLSSNVPLLNGNQTFIGNNTFTGSNTFTGVNTYTNRGNSFVGSFFGNGLVGWIPVSVTATQAMPDAGYLLLSSSLTTVTLPPTNQMRIGDIIRVAGGGTGGWLVALNANESILGNFLIASNNSWLQANATSAGWQTIASSADGGKMVASVPGGSGIFISTDSGHTWTLSTASYSPIAVASSASGSTLFGASYPAGGIEYSTNAGMSWNLASGTPTTNWYGITASSDGTRAAAIIYGGGIYTSQNTGANWAYAGNAPSEGWISIASSADGTKLAALVFGGDVWTSSDAGNSWTQQSSLPNGSWFSIASSADGSKLVAVANTGGGSVSNVVYTSLNYGTSWTRSASAPPVTWYHVTCSQDGGKIYAVANVGGIYASADFGLSWTAEPVPNEPWRGVACSSDGSKAAAVYLSTTSSGMIYYGQANQQLTTTSTGTSGYITGSQGAAVELQYIGNSQFMPVGMTGTLWAN